MRCWARWWSLADLVGKPMPLCGAVLALVRERARQAGLYPD